MVSLRKSLLFCLILMVALPLALGFNVETDIPTDVNYLDEVPITLSIEPTDYTEFDVLIILPQTWEITDWNTNIGKEIFAEHRDTDYLGEQVSAFRWKFEDVTQDITLSCTAKATTTGNQKVVTLWTYPGGFDSEESQIYVQSTMLQPSLFWLIILLIATAIVIFGVIYKEYMKNTTRAQHKKGRTSRDIRKGKKR